MNSTDTELPEIDLGPLPRRRRSGPWETCALLFVLACSIAGAVAALPLLRPSPCMSPFTTGFPADYEPYRGPRTDYQLHSESELDGWVDEDSD